MSQIWVGQEKSCFTQNLSLKWVISLQHQYILQHNWPEFPAKRLLLLLFIWRPDHPELKSTGSLPLNQWNRIKVAGQNVQPGWPWWELRGSKLTPGVMKEPFRLPCQPRCFLLYIHPTCHEQLSKMNTHSEGDPTYTNRKKGTPSERAWDPTQLLQSLLLSVCHRKWLEKGHCIHGPLLQQTLKTMKKQSWTHLYVTASYVNMYLWNGWSAYVKWSKLYRTWSMQYHRLRPCTFHDGFSFTLKVQPGSLRSLHSWGLSKSNFQGDHFWFHIVPYIHQEENKENNVQKPRKT